MSVAFLPLQSRGAAKEPSSLVVPKTTDSAEAKTLELRLNEINSMNKTSLKASEKRSLRKEVRSINHKLREISGGVYLSAGAVIIIVILLIVLL